MTIKLLHTNHHIVSVVMIRLRRSDREPDCYMYVVSKGPGERVVAFYIPTFAVRDNVILDNGNALLRAMSGGSTPRVFYHGTQDQYVWIGNTPVMWSAKIAINSTDRMSAALVLELNAPCERP